MFPHASPFVPIPQSPYLHSLPSVRDSHHLFQRRPTPSPFPNNDRPTPEPSTRLRTLAFLPKRAASIFLNGAPALPGLQSGPGAILT